MDIDESHLPLTSYRERTARGYVVFSTYITIMLWDPKSDGPRKILLPSNFEQRYLWIVNWMKSSVLAPKYD